MSLIDRNVLLEVLETVDFCKCSTYGAEALLKDSVLEAIQQIDPIDVVGCKYCKRFEPIENGTGACVDDYGSVMGIHNDDWFCADGERKC